MHCTDHASATFVPHLLVGRKEKKIKEKKPCTCGRIRCVEASAAYVQAGEAARGGCRSPGEGEEDGGSMVTCELRAADCRVEAAVLVDCGRPKVTRVLLLRPTLCLLSSEVTLIRLAGASGRKISPSAPPTVRVAVEGVEWLLLR